MTSLLTRSKQIPANGGYYINIGDCRTTFYANTSGSDSAPTFSSSAMVQAMSTAGSRVSTFIVASGAGVFRDHGKTLISSGRTFRKVQLMVSTGTSTEGVAGSADGVNSGVVSQPSGYLTGYIELPGTGGATSNMPTSGAFTPVARLG